MTRLLLPILLSLVALPVLAESREEVIARLVASGTHETAEERHSVEVRNCILTTYRWRLQPDGAWLLWSSFTFPMAEGRLEQTKDGKRFVAIPGTPQAPEMEMALVVFKMPEGKPARFERSHLRKIRGEYRPSPRGDGTTHYYEDVFNFFYRHQGPGAVAKAEVFTETYQTYVRDYCQFIG